MHCMHSRLTAYMQCGGQIPVANWSMQYIAQWAGRESDGCMGAVVRADTSGESLQLGGGGAQNSRSASMQWGGQIPVANWVGWCEPLHNAVGTGGAWGLTAYMQCREMSLELGRSDAAD